MHACFSYYSSAVFILTINRDPSCIDLSVIIGFILNVPSDYKFGFVTLPLRKRHWIAVRRIENQYYNLDSKLYAPECIGGAKQLLDYLRAQLKTNERELFVITENKTPAVCWLKEDETPAAEEAEDVLHNGQLA